MTPSVVRLLVITARWPTADRPSAGVFVKDRLRGVPHATVVAHGSYRTPRAFRFVTFVWRALSAGGGYDGVEAHFLLPAGPPALLAARLRGIPLVVYAHGSDVREFATRSPLHAFLARIVARGADAVVTNSRHTAEYVEALGAEARIIPPGVDLERFRPSPRPARRSVLYLGGRDEKKGYAVAVDVADTVAGPGLDEIQPDAVPARMAEHDVVLVPSVNESFGLVAAQAIASGRWVVARAVGGLGDVVTDGVNGTLVDDGDFAGAVERVPDYDPYAVAESAGRFDVGLQREALQALWDEILAKRGARG